LRQGERGGGEERDGEPSRHASHNATLQRRPKPVGERFPVHRR